MADMFEARVFCGTYSKDGSTFMCVCQGEHYCTAATAERSDTETARINQLCGTVDLGVVCGCGLLDRSPSPYVLQISPYTCMTRMVASSVAASTSRDEGD